MKMTGEDDFVGLRIMYHILDLPRLGIWMRRTLKKKKKKLTIEFQQSGTGKAPLILATKRCGLASIARLLRYPKVLRRLVMPCQQNERSSKMLYIYECPGFSDYL